MIKFTTAINWPQRLQVVCRSPSTGNSTWEICPCVGATLHTINRKKLLFAIGSNSCEKIKIINKIVKYYKKSERKELFQHITHNIKCFNTKQKIIRTKTTN